MLARALRLDRYAVLGHSYGAFVALQNAVDYPGHGGADDRVERGTVASVSSDRRSSAACRAFEPASSARTGAGVVGARAPRAHAGGVRDG